MRVFLNVLGFAAFVLLNGFAAAGSKINDVEQVLDTFHQAASDADGTAYFALLHDKSVFMGTDGTERWSKAEFRQFADPYFNSGKGWTYLVTERHVSVSDDGKTAWFDEMLKNNSYGVCRGSGVLIDTPDGWQIMQYNLSIPIPNDLAQGFAKQIKALGAN